MHLTSGNTFVRFQAAPALQFAADQSKDKANEKPSIPPVAPQPPKDAPQQPAANAPKLPESVEKKLAEIAKKYGAKIEVARAMYTNLKNLKALDMPDADIFAVIENDINPKGRRMSTMALYEEGGGGFIKPIKKPQ